MTIQRQLVFFGRKEIGSPKVVPPGHKATAYVHDVFGIVDIGEVEVVSPDKIRLTNTHIIGSRNLGVTDEKILAQREISRLATDGLVFRHEYTWMPGPSQRAVNLQPPVRRETARRPEQPIRYKKKTHRR